MTVLFVLTGGSLPHQPGNLQRFFGGFHATKNHGKPKAIKVNRLGGNPERAEITRKPSTDLFVDRRVVGKTSIRVWVFRCIIIGLKMYSV